LNFAKQSRFQFILRVIVSLLHHSIRAYKITILIRHAVVYNTIGQYAVKTK